MAAAMIKTIRRNAKPYQLTPSGVETYDDDGYATETATVSVTTDIVIQPMGPKELRNVPEGQNTLKWISLWSEADLPEKYKVNYGGIDYTIQKTEFWDDGPFWAASAVHVKD